MTISRVGPQGMKRGTWMKRIVAKSDDVSRQVGRGISEGDYIRAVSITDSRRTDSSSNT